MDIRLELVKNSIFNTYILPIITTMIGVVFGGIVTIVVNSYNSKKEKEMDLRIKLWGDLIVNMTLIRGLLMDVIISINEYRDDDSWEEFIKEIKEKIVSIKKELQMVLYKIDDNSFITLDLIYKCEAFIKSIETAQMALDDLTGNEYLEIVEFHINSLNKIFRSLKIEIESDLFKGLYSTRKINKSVKNNMKKS